MTNIHIVQGRVTLGATVIAALIKKSGKYNYRIKSHDDKECVIDFYEDGELVGSSSFSMEDAKIAGLTGKDVWKKFPRNMLFARSISNGARWFCADVFGGSIYTPEELEEDKTETKETKSPYHIFIEDCEREFGLTESEVKNILREKGVGAFVTIEVDKYKTILAEHSKVIDGHIT